MSTHPGMLVAYDAAGNIIATQDYRVVHDEDDVPLGLVDFAAHEDAGGAMTDVWFVEQETDGVVTPARGSKVWPEYLGAAAHDFRVELAGPPGQKQIVALVHKTSGARRERHHVTNAIEHRLAAANGAPADIRDLVGGPERPLKLDDSGGLRVASARPLGVASLPLVRGED